ncbi:hypothetical protein [Marinimicrobium locisalis]|uniref:hypothetical protein n=1 Tax=Marinimicrobium locisalis TaxID=546022 RepID=UPI003222228A
MNQLPSKTPSSLKALSVALLAGSLFACGGSSNPLPNNPVDETDPPEPVPEHIDLSFMVQTHDGARLSDVTVTLGEDTTAQTDAAGRVQFSPETRESYRVHAQAEGFIPQALKIDGESDGIVPIRLMPIKQTLSVEDIEAARTLSAVDLGARITFPANAFVTPDGEPASGEATVQVTPWDITGEDLNAMPGNAQALDAGGDSAELISAGMMTVDVHNAQGDYLQLSPNATAEIQMDLPVESINNEALSIGSTIPMWHFDEDQGLWVEDDSTMGTVVASATSPVGLAVRAEVSHFSTWNWDFKFENGGSINVECRLGDSSAVPCGINAEVELDDGSIFTRAGQLPAGGATIINMPNSATIGWSAVSEFGLMGEKTTDMSGDVIIDLGEPSSENLVRCELPDGSPVGCSVTLTDGTETATHSVPAEGATIVTGWPNLDENTQLTWSAETPYPITVDGQQVLGEGTATSDVAGDVTVSLAVTPIEAVNVQCLAGSGVSIPCTVDVLATLSDGTVFTENDVLIQDSESLIVPAEATLIQWSAHSNGAYSQNGQFVELSGSMETGLVGSVSVILDEETVQGAAAQSINLSCINGPSSSASSCDIEVFVEGNRVGYLEIGNFPGVALGDSVTLEFPEGMSAEGEWVQIMATGDDGSMTYTFEPYESFTQGQSVELALQCEDAAGGVACPE